MSNPTFVFPFPCTGSEPSGAVEIIDKNGNIINTIEASQCFADWYCPPNGWLWRWRDGPPAAPQT